MFHLLHYQPTVIVLLFIHVFLIFCLLVCFALNLFSVFIFLYIVSQQLSIKENTVITSISQFKFYFLIATSYLAILSKLSEYPTFKNDSLYTVELQAGQIYDYFLFLFDIHVHCSAVKSAEK